MGFRFYLLQSNWKAISDRERADCWMGYFEYLVTLSGERWECGCVFVFRMRVCTIRLWHCPKMDAKQQCVRTIQTKPCPIPYTSIRVRSPRISLPLLKLAYMEFHCSLLWISNKNSCHSLTMYNVWKCNEFAGHKMFIRALLSCALSRSWEK